MSENQPKENEGVFIGKALFEPMVQFTPSGHAKAELLVVRTESWTSQGETKSKDVTILFKFFGKPAEWLEKKNLKGGERVRVIYQLGSFEGKNKETGEMTGKHYPDLKGFTVDVSTKEAAPTPPPTSNFDF